MQAYVLAAGSSHLDDEVGAGDEVSELAERLV
jgi:hypothetical protein